MLEIVGDIWKQKCNWLCVTTNGIVKSDGRAVMGRGIALDAKTRYQGLDKLLAEQIQNRGNIVDILYYDDMNKRCIVSFPTKHDWKDKSDIQLISDSAITLKITSMNIQKLTGVHPIVAMTRPGCGCGGLNWEKEVKPVLEIILTSDRFLIFTQE